MRGLPYNLVLQFKPNFNDWACYVLLLKPLLFQGPHLQIRKVHRHIPFARGMHEYAKCSVPQLCVIDAEKVDIIDEEVHLAAMRPDGQAAAAGCKGWHHRVLQPANLAGQAAAKEAVHLGAAVAREGEAVMAVFVGAQHEAIFVLAAAKIGAGGDLCIEVVKHGIGARGDQVFVIIVQAQVNLAFRYVDRCVGAAVCRPEGLIGEIIFEQDLADIGSQVGRGREVWLRQRARRESRGEPDLRRRSGGRWRGGVEDQDGSGRDDTRAQEQ